MITLVNIKKNTLASDDEKQYNYVWPFEDNPILPLKKCGKLYHIGWDIPARWALDNSGQWWADNAHGHNLEKSNNPPKIEAHNQWKEQDCGQW